ncbi:hypothetical protein LDG_8642 [Legionella drancourtii LLAP12]|uniref:Uncharacterized protein n=1 Tax=Legionella drancourtii LLAP12 TaxID=658187 RepID=G9ETK9_9GAMM|nr:hypothetical protein LDG_8642 [Legionella drancourtii LLAP12]
MREMKVINETRVVERNKLCRLGIIISVLVADIFLVNLKKSSYDIPKHIQLHNFKFNVS